MVLKDLKKTEAKVYLCRQCGGTGNANNTGTKFVKCPDCEGKGKVVGTREQY